ncbi:hypothetical protein LCGC14_1879220 [marine sediment metagenome]|uniref:Uncharacterized protein n=2 Tax=root TaxID=1 RepID=A0A0F9IGT9_9ZZZZ|nr:MAG: hypothetical protein LCMAC202_03970 [Marseillevirus LCMAC202]
MNNFCIEQVRTFLKNQDTQTLRDLRIFIDEKIEEKTQKSVQTQPPGTSTLRREYEKRAPKGSPEFDVSLVRGTAQSHGGFEASYDNGQGIHLYAKAYITWRLDDLDMFTDVSGIINGEHFLAEAGS